MISRHGQFTWDLRRQTVLYIIKTAKGAKMSNETLFLAINTFDRVLSSDSFLQIENIELETLCQIALACVLLAAKYFGDEYFHNKMVDGSFVKFKQDCFQKLLSNVKDCIQTKTLFLIERIVYKIINANLTSCDPMYFLVRDGSFISKERSISRVSWIMRMALLDQAFVSAKPSELVASSAFLAELSLGIEDWDETNFAFFGVSKPIVVKLAIKLRNYIIEMDEDDLNENDMCHLNTIEDVTGLEND